MNSAASTGNGKAPTRDGQGAFWGDLVGRNPTDRGKPGHKRSLIVEADGGRWGGDRRRQRSRYQLLEKTIRRSCRAAGANEQSPQHLCLDRGTIIPPGRRRWRRKLTRRTSGVLARRSSTARVERPARLAGGWWERTLGWLSKCRGILVRYAKKSCNYLGVVQLACGLLWYRRQHRLAVLR